MYDRIVDRDILNRLKSGEGITAVADADMRFAEYNEAIAQLEGAKFRLWAARDLAMKELEREVT